MQNDDGNCTKCVDTQSSSYDQELSLTDRGKDGTEMSKWFYSTFVDQAERLAQTMFHETMLEIAGTPGCIRHELDKKQLMYHGKRHIWEKKNNKEPDTKTDDAHYDKIIDKAERTAQAMFVTMVAEEVGDATLEARDFDKYQLKYRSKRARDDEDKTAVEGESSAKVAKTTQSPAPRTAVDANEGIVIVWQTESDGPEWFIIPDDVFTKQTKQIAEKHGLQGDTVYDQFSALESIDLNEEHDGDAAGSESEYDPFDGVPENPAIGPFTKEQQKRHKARENAARRAFGVLFNTTWNEYRQVQGSTKFAPPVRVYHAKMYINMWTGET